MLGGHLIRPVVLYAGKYGISKSEIEYHDTHFPLSYVQPHCILSGNVRGSSYTPANTVDKIKTKQTAGNI